MSRQPAGQSSINLHADGLYHTWVVLGHDRLAAALFDGQLGALLNPRQGSPSI